MVNVNGTMRGFAMTTGAYISVCDMCPDEDIGRLREMFDCSPQKRVVNLAKVISILSKGYEDFQRFNGCEYKEPLSATELIATTTPAGIVMLYDLAMKEAQKDLKTSIELKPAKKQSKKK